MLMTLNSTLNKKKKKGFTLIELIIVIAIIAILAALALPKFMSIKGDANKKADISNAKSIQNAVATLIAQDKITLPATGATKTIVLDGAVSNTDSDDTKNVKGYLQNIPSPKAATGKFKAVIDDKGTVTIYNKTATDDSGDKEILPIGVDPYQ